MQVRIADRTEEPLSRHKWAFVKELAWLSDGSGIMMSARRPDESGIYHIWYVSYPDGVERQVTSGLDRQVGVSVSSDSRHILTVQESTLSSIWRMPWGRRNPQLIPFGETGTSAPIWTRDGQIIFEEEIGGRRNLWTVDANGGNRKQLTQKRTSYDHCVSDDGKKLAFISDRDGETAIWTADIDGRKAVMVTKVTGEPVPALSPDGRWIAFTAIGSQHWTTLWRVESNGSSAVELNDKLWLRPVISPDGKWIAGFYGYRQLGTQKFPDNIAVISADGGQPRKVIPISSSVSLSAGIRWSPDGRGLTYVESGKDDDNIWIQPLDGDAAQQITRFQGLTLFSFDWSRDGKQLAFSRGILARDVVLIEDSKRN
jgi:Tol biopolymer transport system component